MSRGELETNIRRARGAASERLRRIIDGRDVPAHGEREMPVWGDGFKSPRGGFSEESVAARIAAILKYLEGIQARSGD